MTSAAQAPPTPGMAARWLVTASAGSAFGDGIRYSALPLLAMAVLGDPFQVAVVAASSGVPWLLFGLPIGLVADRRDRRTMMIAADLVRAIVLILAAVLALTGQLSLFALVLLGLLLGTSRVAFDCASTAYVADIVNGTHLMAVNGRMMSAQIAGRDLAGQAAGGALFGAGRAVPLVADAATFLFSAVCIATLPRSPARRLPRSHPLREIGKGITFIANDRTMLSLVGAAIALNVVFSAQSAIFVTFAQRDLHLSPVLYGLVLAGGGVGGVLGGLTVQRVVRRCGSKSTLLLATALLAMSYAGTAIAPSGYVAATAYVVTGLSLVWWNAVGLTLRQCVTPSDMLGRVTGTSRFLTWGAAPLGALVAGGLTVIVGVRLVILIGAGVALLLLPVLVVGVAVPTPHAEAADRKVDRQYGRRPGWAFRGR